MFIADNQMYFDAKKRVLQETSLKTHRFYYIILYTMYSVFNYRYFSSFSALIFNKNCCKLLLAYNERLYKILIENCVKFY